MKRSIMMLIAALSVLLFAGTGLAQDQGDATVQVMQSEQYGSYLTDAEGFTLYLFLDEEMEGEGPDRMTEGVREAAVSCTGECLAAWPAFTSEGDVQAGEGADAELLYTAEFDGRSHVVYNGWPLFYFEDDTEPEQIEGQDLESFGGVWYIVGPDGHHVELEEEEGEGEDGEDGEDGEADDAAADDAAEDGAADGAAEDGADGDGMDGDGAAGDGADDAEDAAD